MTPVKEYRIHAREYVAVEIGKSGQEQRRLRRKKQRIRNKKL